jgi:hypothetical protein
VPSFGDLARIEAAPLEDLALAVAAEFEPVDDDAARARLDHLATGARDVTGLEPTARARALVDALGDRAGFVRDDGRDPAAGMLDRVLERRRGHPVALAVVYVAVARRAGFELRAVGNRSACLIGDPHADPPVAIDPAPCGGRPSEDLHWICPHLMTLRVINVIGARYIARGDLARGIRAAELRLQLPLEERSRDRHRTELNSLRALLN